MELRLLTQKDLKYSEVLKEYGAAGGSTDFALLTGGLVNLTPNVAEFEKTKDGVIALMYWLGDKRQSQNEYNKYVNTNGVVLNSYATNFAVSVRPVIDMEELPYDTLSNVQVKTIKDYRSELDSFTIWSWQGRPQEVKSDSVDWKEIRIKTVKFGSFPQNLADASISEELENEFQSGNLKQTKQCFTVKKSKGIGSFNDEILPVYKFNHRRYVRIVCSDENDIFASKALPPVLSDGSRTANDRVCWLEVAPIEWLVDERNHKLIAKNCLISGIPFQPNKKVDIGVFSYMNDYMKNEMQQNMVVSLSDYKNYLAVRFVLNSSEGLGFYRSLFEYMNTFIKTHNTDESENEIKQFTKEAVIQMSSGKMTVDSFKNSLKERLQIYFGYDRLDNNR